MIEYNQRIDQQISDALRRDGSVPADGLPGLDGEQGAVLLRRYVEVHSSEVPIVFDGYRLTWATPRESVAAGGAPSDAAPRLSPVDQVLAVPVGKSLLDSAPSGARVNRAFWLLPFSLGLLGGLIAWFVVRSENSRVAKSLLFTGVAVQLVSLLMGIALAPMLGSMMSASGTPAGSAAWAASATGRPTFHYFGTAT